MRNDGPDADHAAWIATRRAVVRRAAGASALFALPAAGLLGARVVGAKDDGDDHGDGHGRGRGRGRGGDGDGDQPAAGVAGGAAAPAAPGAVTIVGRAFQPATLTIAPGQTVTWRNLSDDDHTASGAAFDTGVIPPGGSGVATFATAGAFPYQCNFHPEMQGTVIVAGAAAAEPQTAATADAGTADDGTNDIVGVWRVRLDAPAFGAYEGLATFHPDGALAAAYVPAADADAAAPALGPSHGVWDTGNDGGYRHTTVLLLLDDAGRFAGELTIRETGQIDAGGDAYAGSFAGEIAGADGSVRPIGAGTTTGQRIEIETAAPAVSAQQAAAPAATPAVAAASAASDVTIRDFAFDPATLEIAVGATVTWRNDGAAPHTATAADGAFDTGQIDPGQQATAAFDQPGSFAYRCAFHPNMEGTIVVQ